MWKLAFVSTKISALNSEFLGSLSSPHKVRSAVIFEAGRGESFKIWNKKMSTSAATNIISFLSNFVENNCEFKKLINMPRPKHLNFQSNTCQVARTDLPLFSFIIRFCHSVSIVVNTSCCDILIFFAVFLLGLLIHPYFSLLDPSGLVSCFGDISDTERVCKINVSNHVV